MLDKLAAPRDDIVQPPFEMPESSIKRQADTVPHLQNQVFDMYKVKNGRDAELQLYEVQGTWKRGDGSSQAVKVITPDLHRRGSLGRYYVSTVSMHDIV